MPDKPAVSVIIVNYNGRSYLNNCLGALKTQSFADFEVILVDNGSTDGSLEYIEREYPAVRVIKNTVNCGFARGNNQGIEAARGKYILTLNNDTVADPHWIAELVRAAESDERIGMCASKICLANEPGVIDSVGMLIYPDGTAKQRGGHERDAGQYDRPEEVLLPSAAAALYRKSMLDDVGLFDEDFFAYCEDADLGLRARLRGWKCYFVPAAKVAHYYSGTAGKYSSFKAFLVERNHIWLAFKLFPLPVLLAFPLYSLKRFIIQAASVFVLRDRSLKKSALPLVLLRAYFCAIISLYPVLSKRRSIQKRKTVSNAEIGSWFKKYGLTRQDLILKE